MIRDSIAKCRVFSGLEQQQIEDLVQCVNSRSYADGDVICEEGELGTALHLLLSGRVVVSTQINDNSLVACVSIC